MSFLPAIGVGGITGWRVLQSTAAQQQTTFERSPTLQRNIEYFRENVKNATSIEDLVNDRRLLTVALGAFGLSDELNKKGLIVKILEGGTEDVRSLANRFPDTRYKEFAEAFSYGNIDGGSKILLNSFREDIIARYKTLEFERAVGDVDNDIRLAMNFKREISKITGTESEPDTKWLQIMGNRPLREVIATALGVPEAVAQLDLDRQVEIFSDRARGLLGDATLDQLNEVGAVDDLIRRFFLNRQLQSGPTATTPGVAALTLLQSSSLGGIASGNLLLSQTLL